MASGRVPKIVNTFTVSFSCSVRRSGILLARRIHSPLLMYLRGRISPASCQRDTRSD